VTTFANTTNPTPFGLYDDDTTFQSDADKIVTFVKRKLGDDILSVELSIVLSSTNIKQNLN
jgi:hypothetical protein